MEAETIGIIDKHEQKVNTGCISQQMHFLGVFGAAAPGVTLFGVIGP